MSTCVHVCLSRVDLRTCTYLACMHHTTLDIPHISSVVLEPPMTQYFALAQIVCTCADSLHLRVLAADTVLDLNIAEEILRWIVLR